MGIYLPGADKQFLVLSVSFLVDGDTFALACNPPQSLCNISPQQGRYKAVRMETSLAVTALCSLREPDRRRMIQQRWIKSIRNESEANNGNPEKYYIAKFLGKGEINEANARFVSTKVQASRP